MSVTPRNSLNFDVSLTIWLRAKLLLSAVPIGEGNGTPLQYSCLENPMDGGQVSRGSAGEYQADEQAGVAWLLWRVPGR